VIDGACPGTCVTRPAAGEACTWGGVACTDDAYCNDGRCKPLVGEGAACNGDSTSAILGPGSVLPEIPEPPPGLVLCDRGLHCEQGRCAAVANPTFVEV